ncbi:MAG: hypothetical protein NT069_14375 [Planctomycetota bacterium]|nr:hypothetical protein [Planctomycetota bacterium]
MFVSAAWNAITPGIAREAPEAFRRLVGFGGAGSAIVRWPIHSPHSEH